jgi:hypothetical protein
MLGSRSGHAAAATAGSDLLQLLSVVPLATADFQRALGLALTDFEDGVQAAACLQVNADSRLRRLVGRAGPSPQARAVGPRGDPPALATPP